MADNITLNAGSGGSSVATDDISGVHYQLIKLGYGALDSFTIVTASAGLPVAVVGSVPVTGTFWQATQPVSLASVPSHAVTNAGTFAVQVTSAPTTAVTGPLTDTQLRASEVPVSIASVPSHAVTNAGTFAVQAAQSGTWSVRVQDGSGNALTSAARGSERAMSVQVVDGSGTQVTSFGGTNASVSATGSSVPASATYLGANVSGNLTGVTAATRGSENALSVQIVDGSGAQITSFGGSGGTASNFGSADPSSGTAVGFSDGTNMREARVFDADSGAGTQYVLGTNLRKIASGGSVEAGTSSDPLRVDPTGTTAQPASQSGTWNITNVSGTVSLPTGAATAAKQPALGTAGTASSDVITVQGIASMTKLLVTPDANSAVNISQMNGVAVTMGNGVSGTGVQRVTIASDSTGTVAATQSGTWNVGTVTTVTTCSTVTNLSQLGGNAIAMGTGTRSSGTQRVTIATDDVVPASQSGTWTVQPGNTANTTPWLVTPAPATSGGPTPARIKAASGTNATLVRNQAAQLYGYDLSNNTSSARWIHFYNSASTPTAGSGTPLFSVLVPASGGKNVEWSMGIPFGSGIGYTITTGASDTDTGSCSADDVHGVLLYK